MKKKPLDTLILECFQKDFDEPEDIVDYCVKRGYSPDEIGARIDPVYTQYLKEIYEAAVSPHSNGL